MGGGDAGAKVSAGDSRVEWGLCWGLWGGVGELGSWGVARRESRLDGPRFSTHPPPFFVSPKKKKNTMPQCLRFFVSFDKKRQFTRVPFEPSFA
jgi:hypothetical protein